MVISEPKRYTLEYAGHRLEVEPAEVGLGHLARLFVDGELKAEQKARNERAQLEAGDFTVLVRWGGFGQVTQCVLVQQLHNGEEGQVQEVPFAPPPGTRAARLAKLEREQPELYAARHLIRPILQALVPLLGLGGLFVVLLPRLDWSWIPAPVRDLFDSPDWLAPILNSPFFQVAKWTLPILIAITVAVGEVEKRRAKRREPTQSDYEQVEETRGTHG